MGVIARRFDISRQPVINWRSRYLAHGINGLPDEHRSGRPRPLDRDKMITITVATPPRKYVVTHWSSRLLADRSGVAHGAVSNDQPCEAAGLISLGAVFGEVSLSPGTE
ncbi:helix-turn-helix domain-containing protein [Nocardia callitridis]